MQARLAAIDLACRRSERLLFRGLSLALGPGEALHVTGANGVGKSSLIRILAGLLRPFAGAVERVGAVGLIDERHALDRDVPLAVALRFWTALDGRDETPGRLGLDGLMDIPVRYLSTGQQKRAALARLLSQRATIWLLDEPLNGLDSGGVELVEGLIAEHLAGGGLAVIVSHQPIAANATVLPLTDFAAHSRYPSGEEVGGCGLSESNRAHIPRPNPSSKGEGLR